MKLNSYHAIKNIYFIEISYLYILYLIEISGFY